MKLALARMKPIGAPSCGNVRQVAGSPAGAFSVESSAAPDHSPPSPRPWQQRSSASSPGARISHPGVCEVGRAPMSTVATPMVSSDATSVAFRPMRSPKWPNRIEPGSTCR